MMAFSFPESVLETNKKQGFVMSQKLKDYVTPSQDTHTRKKIYSTKNYFT